MPSGSNGFKLSEADVRVMVQLLGEVAAIRGGHEAKKRYLMNGLADLVGADTWVWCLIAEPTRDSTPTMLNFTHGGFSEERFVRFLEASQHPASAQNTATILKAVEESRSQQTRLREQLISTEQFLTSEAHQSWTNANIGGVLLSIRPIGTDCRSAIGLYRNMERPLFTPREAKIAHIVLSEIQWLHEQGWPEDRGVTVPSLSPRERLVLNLLLEGYARKQIADHLVLSENTFSGYCKKIYRHFRVQSQSELLVRFFRGDGGDIAR